MAKGKRVKGKVRVKRPKRATKRGRVAAGTRQKRTKRPTPLP